MADYKGTKIKGDVILKFEKVSDAKKFPWNTIKDVTKVSIKDDWIKALTAAVPVPPIKPKEEKKEEKVKYEKYKIELANYEKAHKLYPQLLKPKVRVGQSEGKELCLEIEQPGGGWAGFIMAKGWTHPSKKDDGPEVVGPQQIKGPVVIWKKEVGKNFETQYKDKLPWLKGFSGNGEVKISVNEDLVDLLEEIGGAVIHQRMVDQANVLFDKCLKLAYDDVKGLQKPDKEKLGALQISLFQHFQKTQPVFNSIPQKEWDKFVAGNEQYKAYKMQAKSEAVLTGLKAIGTAAAIGMAVPTFGGTIAFAIYGGLTTTADAAVQIRDALADADGIAKNLVKSLEKLKKEFDGSEVRQLTAKAKQVGGTVLNTLTNYPALPTIGDLRDQYVLAVKKLDGLDKKHVNLGSKVVAVIAGSEKLEKELAKPDYKDFKEAAKNLNTVRKTITKLMDSSAKVGKRIDYCLVTLRAVKPLLDEIEKGAGSYVTAFDEYFPKAFNAVVAAASLGMGAADANGLLDGLMLAKDGIEIVSDELKSVKK